MTSVGFRTPPLEYDTAMTGEEATPLTNACVTNGDMLDCSWYDTGSSVSDMGVTQNAQWTPDPFNDLLCRNYMTLCTVDELFNEALPLLTVGLPSLPTAAGFSGLEIPRFGLDFNYFHSTGAQFSSL